MKKAIQKYINNYKGFSKEIWILTLVTFINRAGTMVLPFLSKYLREDLAFTLPQVGWIMVSFGMGSMAGSWLGGKLSDKIGFYKIMVFSLAATGVLFFFMQYVTSFYGLLFAMFLIMAIADMFRPAMFVSIGAYAKEENRTRALTLVRLAVNLGFAAGPALGGLIIMGMGYQGLFWVDGASCLISITIFALLVKEKKKSKFNKEEIIPNANASVFKDKIFWLFLVTSLISGILFFQLFTTLPIYHADQFKLTEFQTGLLLTFNGGLIFLLEMPIVSYIEKHKISRPKIILLGAFLMAVSFFFLEYTGSAIILIVMMLFMTLGEMLIFPFANTFALSRAPKGHEGRYMAIFTMSYSLAHILSAKTGFTIIDLTSYNVNWLFMGGLGLVGTLFAYRVYQLTEKEKI